MRKIWLLAIGLSVLPPGVAASKPLSGPEIEKLMPGKTISGTEDGEAYSETLRRDGSLAGRSGRDTYEGEWYVRGNKLCLYYEEDEDDDAEEDCSRVDVTGSTITFTGNGPASQARIK